MIRAILALTAMIGVSACVTNAVAPNSGGVGQSEAVDQTAIDLLAQTYTLGIAGASLSGCRVTLAAAPALHTSGHVLRPVTFNSACRENFPLLRAIAQWAPTGGASLAFFGGAPPREIADFSPVQDGEGVYLRGALPGDARIYELRPPEG